MYSVKKWGKNRVDPIFSHKPVMVAEVLECLNPRPGAIIVDATVGLGGHAREILRRIIPGGMLIGIDQDREALKLAGENLEEFAGSYKLIYGNFRRMDGFLEGIGLEYVDGVLLDLGVSSFQLDTPQRGFSFRHEGALDMRMDASVGNSAYELANEMDERSLDGIIKNFGEERFHRRIASAIVRYRKRKRIETTTELAEVILRALPHIGRPCTTRCARVHGRRRLHPATRTFQALRIAVNEELDVLTEALDIAIGLLKAGGRLCVLSYHSLEDRIVKCKFRKCKEEGSLELLTKKPLRPTGDELILNPRAWSARLRAASRTKTTDDTESR